MRQVKEGGTIFFRESCFKQSGDAKRASNPTHYRNPRDYFSIFDATEVTRDPSLLIPIAFLFTGCHQVKRAIGQVSQQLPSYCSVATLLMVA